MDSTGVTEFPPGPHLSRLGHQKVFVTRPGNDNIGEILTSMGVEFEPFDGSFECSLLFVNCGTPDQVDPRGLAEFVRSGGCLYASDHADTLIAQAFPGVFDFGGRSGSRGQVSAEVIDPELKDVLGGRIDVEFDMGAWAVLRRGKAESLLTAAKGSQQAGNPIMAYAKYGEGSIFYTCFHNKAQTSDRETRLLQLLVVKQFSATSNRSFEQAGKSLGLALDEIRSDLRR
ncbi:hypothetical protein G7072_14375 [Nocardioides sp. HDW12B]|uniref:hypothetical protein n=1 Tax=Nocardioides sp. HDW12B TaxID=2714939 RepID=UPI001409C917|nr:hypothetical protein [Nocardioides sp. HDW12B]QIK67372.1 hypothetical protein G7072_14375 [Nocardioides sp. HDW12B]